MSRVQTIVFCGGGSIGHVAPALAVAQAMTGVRPDIRTMFVCADRAEEKALLTQANVPFECLRVPRAPRNISLQTCAFPFGFIRAYRSSVRLLHRERPACVFSRGGMLSVPVCLAARRLGIPFILHESDSVFSRTSRLLSRFAKTVCTGFRIAGLTPLLQAKTVQTGNPVRSAIFLASRAAGQRITKFSCRRPVLMIVGGSQGALALNEAVDRRFEELLEVADVIHLTGIGKGIAKTHARYFARPYVLEDLPHLYALADLVITRAGAGTLSELAALRKAAIVIPLTGVAHDHQMKNAVTLVETGAIELLPQENIDLLLQSVTGLLADTDKRRALGEHLAEAFPSDAAGRIARILLDSLEGQKIQS